MVAEGGAALEELTAQTFWPGSLVFLDVSPVMVACEVPNSAKTARKKCFAADRMVAESRTCLEAQMSALALVNIEVVEIKEAKHK
jgi:hypothetical protein